MKFFLMRHGEAETFAPSDEQRELTPRGVQKLRDSLTSMADLLADVDCIIHSPYTRAIQTAEIVAEILNIEELHSSELWSPENDPKAALAFLEDYLERCSLIVTHMPLVGRIESLCCGGYNYHAAFNCGEVSSVSAEWPAAGMGNCKRLKEQVV